MQDCLFTRPYSDRVAFCSSSVSHVNLPFTTDTASSSPGERTSVSINNLGKQIIGHFTFVKCVCPYLWPSQVSVGLWWGQVLRSSENVSDASQTHWPRNKNGHQNLTHASQHQLMTDIPIYPPPLPFPPLFDPFTSPSSFPSFPLLLPLPSPSSSPFLSSSPTPPLSLKFSYLDHV